MLCLIIWTAPDTNQHITSWWCSYKCNYKSNMHNFINYCISSCLVLSTPFVGNVVWVCSALLGIGPRKYDMFILKSTILQTWIKEKVTLMSVGVLPEFGQWCDGDFENQCFLTENNTWFWNCDSVTQMAGSKSASGPISIASITVHSSFCCLLFVIQ